MMAFMAFYDRRFGVPSHQFLHSLLQYYGLDLHNLTPSGILHILAHVTLCEAFMGIDPYFDMWNHYFHGRLPHGSDAKVVV
jgi:hypothetical protein